VESPDDRPVGASGVSGTEDRRVKAARADQSFLVAGLPRAGTTWLAEVVATGGGLPLVNEPDNEVYHPLAVGWKTGLHRFPGREDLADGKIFELYRHAVTGQIAEPFMRALRHLISRSRWDFEPGIASSCGIVPEFLPPGWRVGSRATVLSPAFAAFGRRSMPVVPGSESRRVLKTVHAIRILPEIVDRFDLVPIIAVRNPFALYASLIREISVGTWPTPVVNADVWRGLPSPADVTSPLSVRSARQTCFLIGALRDAVTANPDWVVFSHDEGCRNQDKALTDLANVIGLPVAPAGPIRPPRSTSGRRNLTPTKCARSRMRSTSLNSATSSLAIEPPAIAEGCYLLSTAGRVVPAGAGCQTWRACRTIRIAATR